MNLFIDDRLRHDGFNKTEDYLKFCIDESIATRFYGHEFYESFGGAGILIPNSTIIRAMYVSGNDNFYYVAEDLRLEGVDNLIAHAGPAGLHKARDKLCLENAPDGWELGGYIMFEDRPTRMV